MIAATLALATMIAAAPLPDFEYIPIGEHRITEYCATCNDGAGHESASGKYLEYGDAACNWLPFGTVIDIEGDEFVIVDTCGTDAIDLYVEDGVNGCNCSLNEYKRVAIKRRTK